MKIKSLIIDDNSFVIDLLMDQLRQNHSNVEILGFAKSGSEGLKKIKLLKPDLVFLDVEMDDMTGFEMLKNIGDITFQTIFITSFSHYAIKAIRFNALDYLLKPIKKKELAKAINRHTQTTKSANTNQMRQALINLQIKNSKDQILFLPTQKGTLRLALKQIIKIESDRNYSYIHLSNKTKELASKTLGYFEDILTDKGFYRCNRSMLINKFHIVNQNRDYFLLKDNSRVQISRRRKTEAKNWFLNSNVDEGNA